MKKPFRDRIFAAGLWFMVFIGMPPEIYGRHWAWLVFRGKDNVPNA